MAIALDSAAAGTTMMRLLDRILMAIWDPSGERRREQDERLHRTAEVLDQAHRVGRHARRVARLRASYRAADGRLRR